MTFTVDKEILILVVDDQALSRAMVRATLKGLGFDNVVLLEDGSQAFPILESERVDMIIADWRMPGVSGLELLKRVRSVEKTRHIPFLMLTGDRSRESVMAAVQAGVTDYLGKPFTSQMLSEKVASVMSKKRPAPAGG